MRIPWHEIILRFATLTYLNWLLFITIYCIVVATKEFVCRIIDLFEELYIELFGILTLFRTVFTRNVKKILGG